MYACRSFYGNTMMPDYVTFLIDCTAYNYKNKIKLRSFKSSEHTCIRRKKIIAVFPLTRPTLSQPADSVFLW